MCMQNIYFYIYIFFKKNKEVKLKKVDKYGIYICIEREREREDICHIKDILFLQCLLSYPAKLPIFLENVTANQKQSQQTEQNMHITPIRTSINCKILNLQIVTETGLINKFYICRFQMQNIIQNSSRPELLRTQIIKDNK